MHRGGVKGLQGTRGAACQTGHSRTCRRNVLRLLREEIKEPSTPPPPQKKQYLYIHIYVCRFALTKNSILYGVRRASHTGVRSPYRDCYSGSKREYFEDPLAASTKPKLEPKWLRRNDGQLGTLPKQQHHGRQLQRGDRQRPAHRCSCPPFNDSELRKRTTCL